MPSLVAQRLKRLPAMQRDLGLIPGSGRSLEKEMATHSSILAWRIQWTEEPDGLQSIGFTELDTTERLSTHTRGLPYKPDLSLLVSNAVTVAKGRPSLVDHSNTFPLCDLPPLQLHKIHIPHSSGDNCLIS